MQGSSEVVSAIKFWTKIFYIDEWRWEQVAWYRRLHERYEDGNHKIQRIMMGLWKIGFYFLGWLHRHRPSRDSKTLTIKRGGLGVGSRGRVLLLLAVSVTNQLTLYDFGS